MSQRRLPRELPDPDPGLPRFVWLVYAGVLLLAVGILFRPADGRAVLSPEPRDEMPAQGQDQAALGARLFVSQGCGACHATVGPDGSLGPSLFGLADRAAARVGALDYQGRAVEAAGYVAEASLEHCLDPLPGWDCPDLGGLNLRLSLEDGESLAAFLLGSGSEAPEGQEAP